MRPTQLAIACFLCFVQIAAAETPSTPSAPPGWKLTWSDEFNGSQLDRRKWDFDIGNGFYIPAADGKPGFWLAGWGNDELENYTDRNQNAFVKDGMLHIKAIKEDYKTSHYTSARIKTGGGKTHLFSQKYGRFEFRAKLPTGKGLWPALWLLPQNETYGSWAASGEIDLLEARGHQPDLIQGTLHYGGSFPKNVWYGQQYRLPDHGLISDFHIYTLDWEPGRIRMSVDGQPYYDRNFWWSKSNNITVENPWPAPFNQPFFIVMNVAVGGQFGGNPDATTVFPQEMVIDYVRVYEKTTSDQNPTPRGTGDLNAPSVVLKPAD